MKRNNSDIQPFTLLPKEILDALYPHFVYETHKKGAILLVQEVSRVEKLYILSRGSAQYYYQYQHSRILEEMLGEKETYGGISILMNDGLSVRTLKPSFIRMEIPP